MPNLLPKVICKTHELIQIGNYRIRTINFTNFQSQTEFTAPYTMGAQSDNKLKGEKWLL